MAGLVLAHLMHRVVDGIVPQFLGLRGQGLLAGGGAVLGLDPHGEFFFVSAQTHSPSSSANFAACSASSKAMRL